MRREVDAISFERERFSARVLDFGRQLLLRLPGGICGRSFLSERGKTGVLAYTYAGLDGARFISGTIHEQQTHPAAAGNETILLRRHYMR